MIGYSLPDGDSTSYYLLRMALFNRRHASKKKLNIIVVNRNEATHQKYNNLINDIRGRIEIIPTKPMTFLDWLNLS